MTDLATAISIASTAFENKHDKGNQPYILHCLHVMNQVKALGEQAMIAAVLHDLLEDCPDTWTSQKLLDAGFEPHTVSLIILLTHGENEDYEDYIMRISVSTKACAIKMADLRHNSDIHRMKGLRDKDFDRLKKYHKAYSYLRDIKG